MTISVEDMIANFPPGSVLPPLLLPLLDFQNASREFFSGSFEFVGNGRKTAVAAFDGNAEVAHQFAIFAECGAGSSYAYWFYAERPLDKAPIVYLDSEFDECNVIANTFDEFLALLSLGHDVISSADTEWDEVVELTPRLLDFRRWLADFGINVPTDGRQIVENARKQHPDLDEWIMQWAEPHFGLSLRKGS